MLKLAYLTPLSSDERTSSRMPSFSQEVVELIAQPWIVSARLAVFLDHLTAELRITFDPGFQASPGQPHHG